MMPIRVKRLQNATGLMAPAKAKEGDAGFDLRAAILDDDDIQLGPGQRVLIPTGFAWEIPFHWAGLIRPRSGLAVQAGLHVMAGVVDSGYRDEVRVLAANLGQAVIKINRGDRIAQMLIVPVHILDEVAEVDALSETARGTDGYGSTGVK